MDEGIVFIQLLARQPARELTLSEARAEVIMALNRQLAEEEAAKVAGDELEKIRNLVGEEDFSFKEAAEKLGLKVTLSDYFSREGSDSLPPSAILTGAAFLVPVGEVSDIVPTENGYLFFQVIDRKSPEPMPEDEKETWEEAAARLKISLVYGEWFQNLIRRGGFSITRADLKP